MASHGVVTNTALTLGYRWLNIGSDMTQEWAHSDNRTRGFAPLGSLVKCHLLAVSVISPVPDLLRGRTEFTG